MANILQDIFKDHYEELIYLTHPRDSVIEYIGRYLGRPVIAIKRIDKYDREMVTFHYNRHEDNKYVEVMLATSKRMKGSYVLYQKKNIKYFWTLTNGVRPFFLLSGMIH